MASRPEQPRTVLEALIWQQDRTVEELAHDFMALAETMGERATMSSRHLRRLASGERTNSKSNPVTRRVLQAMFSRPYEELLRPFGQHGDLAPVTAGGLTPQGRATQEEMLTMAAQRARKFALLAGQSGLTDESMEQVYEDVRRLCTLYPQRPLAEILGDMVMAQDTVFSLLENRQRPDHLRQLYFLAGVTGGLLAKASHDLGDPHAAMTQARTAFLCADNASHDGLRAWIRGLQSLVTYWDGRYRDSVRYAKQGAEYASRGHSATNVWLPVSEARAWAALGNVPEVRGAIERGERAWDRVDEDDLDELGGIATFSRARQLYYSADALALLPSEAGEAEDYSRQAVEAYADASRPEWAFGDQAGSMTDLAVARINRGELEGAAEAVAPVLSLPPEKRIRGIIVSAQNVHDALTRSGLAEAGKDLQEEIEVFTRTPVKALPQ